MIYAMYARSPSLSQRPAPTTIASRSPFRLGLCSCSTSLSKMGPRGTRGNEDISEKGTGRFGKRRFGKNMAADVSAKKICRNVSNFFCRNVFAETSCSLYDEEWMKELIKFVDATKILIPRNSEN